MLITMFLIITIISVFGFKKELKIIFKMFSVYFLFYLFMLYLLICSFILKIDFSVLI